MEYITWEGVGGRDPQPYLDKHVNHQGIRVLVNGISIDGTVVGMDMMGQGPISTQYYFMTMDIFNDRLGEEIHF